MYGGYGGSILLRTAASHQTAIQYRTRLLDRAGRVRDEGVFVRG